MLTLGGLYFWDTDSLAIRFRRPFRNLQGHIVGLSDYACVVISIRLLLGMANTHTTHVAFIETLWYAGHETPAHCVASYYGLILDPCSLRYAKHGAKPTPLISRSRLAVGPYVYGF